jgi:glycosyltransferase involved in cell wall biosynthesis
VGRLVERKGLDDAITALAELPDAELLIAGGPPCDDLDDDTDARRLLATAQAHGVSERVKLLGRVSRSDLPALIRSSDAVICVPWYEPFGIVPLEAMACGVPVVASTVGGLVDTVVDGVTGIHVPPRDPPRLASALRRLLADPRLMSSLGAAGVQRVQRRYRWDRVAASTRSVYQEVLESNRNRARAVTR